MNTNRAILAILAMGLVAGTYGCDRVPEEMEDEPAAPTAQYETDTEQTEQEQAQQQQDQQEPEEPPDLEDLEPALQSATVEITEEVPYGQYLIGQNDMSVYLFEADEPGESTCYDECAEMWPPYIVEGEVDAGEGIDGEKLTTIERRDGQQQVAYDGWPLYYFAKDDEMRDTEGHDVEGFGGEWYLISPEGEKVHADDDGS